VTSCPGTQTLRKNGPRAHYPGHGMLIAAQIGAKVAKGEMSWG
jgi:hypothetical protein